MYAIVLEIVLSIRRDQVNLLVNGPDQPYFKQKQKNNIAKFWPTGVFNLLFLIFEKKTKKNNKPI